MIYSVIFCQFITLAKKTKNENEIRRMMLTEHSSKVRKIHEMLFILFIFNSLDRINALHKSFIELAARHTQKQQKKKRKLLS